jgi:hypothetical protein
MGKRTNDQSCTCYNCGQTWPRHPALEVVCPTCHAGVGSGCQRPSEHKAFGGFIHVEREQLAVDMGVLPMCPKGPTALGLNSPKRRKRVPAMKSLFD